MGAECVNARSFIREEPLVVRQIQRGMFDTQRITAQRKVTANGQQFIGRDRVETNLVKKAQQPRLTTKIINRVIAIPHLQRTPDELIAARPFHAINAEIRPANSHRVFRSPGSGRVVLGGDQTMTRVERRRDRRPKIDIP